MAASSGPVVGEDSTTAVLSANEAFFESRPVDVRLDDKRYMKINPAFPIIGQTNCVFNLPAQPVGNVQMLQDNLLQVFLSLTTTDGTKIATSEFVALANPIVDVLISNLSLELAGSVVNKNSNFYPFRAHFAKLLSYPNSAKKTWMQVQDWMPDDTGQFHPLDYDGTKNGFVQRMHIFKQKGNFKTEALRKYVTDYQSVYGNLHTDLSSCDAGIPPGVSCKISLEFSSDRFRLCTSNVNSKAIIQIKDMLLYVPLARLNEKIYKSLKSRLAHDEKMTCFYVRTEVNMDSIPMGNSSYEKDISAADQMTPGRLTFGFLSAKQFSGDYCANPFQYSRRFEQTDNTDTSLVHCSWIQDIKLKINGDVIGQLSGPVDKYDDKLAYIRMQMALGLRNTPCGNGISYEDWKDHAGNCPFN